MHYIDDKKMYTEKAWLELHKNAKSYLEQILEVNLQQNSNCTATYFPSQKTS